MLDRNPVGQSRSLASADSQLPDLNLREDLYPAVGYGLQEEEERFDPLRLLLYVVQYRWLIGTLLAIGVVSGAAITYMQTPKYMAAAQMEVMPPAAKVLADLAVIDPSNADRSLETTRQRLLSRDVAGRVVAALNLSQNAKFLFPRADFSVFNILSRVFGVPPAPSLNKFSAEQRQAMAIGGVQGGLSISPVRDTSILSVGFSGPDPKLAADIANQVVRSYMDQQVDQTVSTSDLARQFIQQQVDEAKQKLADSEKALVDYAKTQGITVTESDGSLISSNISTINSALASAVQDQLIAERLVQQVDAGQGPFLPRVINDGEVQKTRGQIADLKAQYQLKLRTFKSDYPDMVTLSAQIGGLQKQLDQQVAAILDSIRLDYQTNENKVADLKAKLADLEQQQVAFQDKNIQYTILSREVDSNRSQYKTLVDKLNSLGVSDLKEPNVNVVDAAMVPGGPYAPSLSKNVMTALAAAAAACAAIIYLLQLLNNKFNIPDDVETQLRLPVLGIIPKIEPNKIEGVLADPKSGLAEAYRSLRTTLQFSGPDGTPKILAITSAEPNECKSTTAYKLAEEFGAIGVKVLLIDTDMRRPSMHRMMKADNTVGLSNLLTSTVSADDMRSVFQDTAFPNVTFLSSGPLVPNPADLLSSHKMSNVVHACAKTYDLIILDGPPVIGLSDAPILSRLAEATLLVVAAHQVSRKSVRGALKRLRATGGNVIGVALAKFAIDRVEYSYAYRYMNDGYYAYGAHTAELEHHGEAKGGALVGGAGRKGRKVDDSDRPGRRGNRKRDKSAA